MICQSIAEKLRKKKVKSACDATAMLRFFRTLRYERHYFQHRFCAFRPLNCSIYTPPSPTPILASPNPILVLRYFSPISPVSICSHRPVFEKKKKKEKRVANAIKPQVSKRIVRASNFRPRVCYFDRAIVKWIKKKKEKTKSSDSSDDRGNSGYSRDARKEDSKRARSLSDLSGIIIS